MKLVRQLLSFTLAAVLVALACAGSAPDFRHYVGTEEYRPALDADVFLPAAVSHDRPRPVVLLVPGGAWRTADRSGLRPLADDLAGRGIVAFTATYVAAEGGGRFPEPVQDVACALSFAVERTRAAGWTPGKVVVVGHSTGAHLAALSVLGADVDGAGCPHAPVRADALVGLAGIYDPADVPELAEELFGGPEVDMADLWRSGDAVALAFPRPEVPIALVYSPDDELVPSRFSEEFAAAARRGGHLVTVHAIPGAGHHDLYAPQTVAAMLANWISAL